MEDYQWYILFVQGGKEEKIIANIETELEKEDNYWAKEDIRELKPSPKIVKSYIFCHCRLTPKLVKFLTKIRGVIGFLNHQKNEVCLPEPVSAATVVNFFSHLAKETRAPVSPPSLELNIGDLVRITEGTFANQEGRITYLNASKSQVKVDLEFLGRKISLNLPTNSCQKAL